MPRKPRLEAPGAIHHVVAKGNAGEAIVRDNRDRLTFVQRLAQAIAKHGWSCLAYCLLDNHFHLVVETPEPNLGVGMKWLKASYAQDFNHRYERVGHVFGGRFYSMLVERDSHLTAAIAYVALNPVRAGVVDRAENWYWSSYAAIVGLVPPAPFLEPQRVLELLDPRAEVARRVLAEAVESELLRDRELRRAPRGQTRGV